MFTFELELQPAPFTRGNLLCYFTAEVAKRNGTNCHCAEMVATLGEGGLLVAKA